MDVSPISIQLGVRATATLAISVLSVSIGVAGNGDNNPSAVISAAASSSCSHYSWKDRNKAPPGFITGTALVYANAYRDLKANVDPVVAVVAAGSRGEDQDALSWYHKAAGPAKLRLRVTYALAIGEGMRESSGNTTEGRDTTAHNATEETAEAGLYQISHDSISRSPWLKSIESKFANHPETCLLDVFMDGVHDKKVPELGNGTGAAFQRMMKTCPAFATEYAVVLLRVNRKHFGPINRHEAELRSECESMLEAIERMVDSGGS
jgi:hypothetical protein